MIYRYSQYLLLFALAASPLAAYAQVDSGEEIPDVTRTYAIVNARVVQAPGRVLDRATIIIRDGLIAEVGTDLDIPFDAERVEADSLIVYAGFIDGLSHVGIPAPRQQDVRADPPEDPGYPTDAEAGIVPGLDVRTLLKADDKSVADLRKAGFTAAHVVPRGRMLPGKGAIILLAGDDANELVYRGETGFYAQFASARRMYPGTDMAVIAKMRQLFTEASRRQRLEQLYEQDPTGLQRPSYDPTHYSLFPALDGGSPLFFQTEDELDVHRALSLREELGFSLVLTGVRKSSDLLSKLESANVPLMLSLDLPEDKSEKEDEESESDTTATVSTDTGGELPEVDEPRYDPLLRVNDYQDLEAEKANLEARRDAERAKYVSSAAAIDAAGLGFGFMTEGTKPDVLLPNVRELIENGLSEDAALAALTTGPAEILGVAATMGSVDEGKMGNLVITKGNIFEEESTIRFVFVDGRKFEMEAKKPRGDADPDAEVTAAGTWAVVASTPDGDMDGTLTINEELDGSIYFEAMPGDLPLAGATLEGNELAFSFAVPGFGEVTVTVVIDGNGFVGEANSPQGAVPFTGTRTSDPENQS